MMGALEGLKVLDFSTLLPGPYATLVLADLGAEVLRVTNPRGHDLVTEWGSRIEGEGVTGTAAWLGRNKKGIFLNLKKPEAVEAVKRLVQEYDVIVEQFRPGVMDRLGLGYGALKEANPQIIYCSITGYGQYGPMRDRAGHDCNYLARSGILSAAGRKGGGPVLYNFQIADVAAGSNNAVIGILSAVYHRMRTGDGQHIDISMSDGALPFNSMDGAEFLAGGEATGREEGPLNGGGIYDFYRTADGGYMSVGSLEPKFFAALCDGLGFTEWRDGKCLSEDPGAVKKAFREKFLEKTRDGWTEIFKPLDACVEPVLSLDEAAADGHFNARGMWPEIPFDDGRRVRQLGCPVKLSECPVEYRHAGLPDGHNTDEILKSMGYMDADIKEMAE